MFDDERHVVKGAAFIRLLIAQQQIFSDDRSVIVVGAREYESLLWYRIREMFIERGEHVVALCIEHAKEPHIELSLTASFIDGTRLMFLVSRSDRKIRDLSPDVIKIVTNYRGPHRIIAIMPPAQAERIDPQYVRMFDDKLDNEDVHALVMLAGGTAPLPQGIKVTGTVDQICMFARAYHLLGASGASWLQQVLMPEEHGSLFMLAQSLFGKDSKKFYALWSAWGSVYPEEFWISFWSERLWQAYVWICAQKAAEPLDIPSPKGLPFQFMKRDWKLYSSDFFIQVLQRLYTLDIHFKTGGQVISFEVIFNMFLLKA